MLTKWQVDKIASQINKKCQYGKITKWDANKVANCLGDKLTKWQVDKVAS
jgi:hypothetical protein